GDVLVEVVADHQHVEMLGDGVAGVGAGRVGGGGDDVVEPAYLDDVGRVAAAGALGVIGVDGAVPEGGNGVLDEAALVEGVGVDHHLHVEGIGDAQAVVDGGGGGAPVLVQLQAGGAGEDHLLERRGNRRDRKSTRLNSSHVKISYAVFCLKQKQIRQHQKRR